MMRRLMSVALIGFAVAAASTVASAQVSGRPQASRAGVRGAAFDSVRSHRIDSLRAVRGDSGRRLDGDSTARGRGGMGPAERGRAALAGVDLTAAQKKDIKAINKKYAGQFKALRQPNGKQNGPPTAEARAQMQALMERERAETRAVLTPAQQTKFDANVAKAGKGRGKHKGGESRT
jgi:Spy/CpxP family protein refolding chaperone